MSDSFMTRFYGGIFFGAAIFHRADTEQHRAAQSSTEQVGNKTGRSLGQTINKYVAIPDFFVNHQLLYGFFPISSCFRLGQTAPIPRAKRPNCLLIGWRFLIHLKRALAIFPHSDPIHRIKAGLRPDEAHQINRFETDASLI